MPAYACMWHKTRGQAVCSMSLSQRADVIEGCIADQLRERVLKEGVLGDFLRLMRSEIEQAMAAPPVDTSVLEEQLKKVRGEQRNLILVAAGGTDDIPELVRALADRSDRIRQLEADLAAVKRTPRMLTEAVDRLERLVREKLLGLRNALYGDREGSREVFRTLFRDGLVFRPADDARKVFEITGTAKLGEVANCLVTPPGLVASYTHSSPLRFTARRVAVNP